jgi:hypothetical protein
MKNELRISCAAIAVATLVPWGTPARADTASQLRRYAGYTIVGTKTIKGWISGDRKKKGDAFEGCDFGRIIIFDDDTYLRCNSYDYVYSYRPDAVLLVRGNSFVMLVENDAYDMTN